MSKNKKIVPPYFPGTKRYSRGNLENSGEANLCSCESGWEGGHTRLWGRLLSQMTVTCRDPKSPSERRRSCVQ